MDENEDIDAAIDAAPSDILRQPAMDTFHTDLFDFEAEPTGENQPRLVEGTWTGHCFSQEGDEWSSEHGALQLSIGAMADDINFEGKCVNYWDILDVVGALEPSEELGYEVVFTLGFSDGYRIRCTGQVDLDAGKISGEWVAESDNTEDSDSDSSSESESDSEDSGAEEEPEEKSDDDESQSEEEDSAEESVAKQIFTFTRTPPAALRFRYNPAQFSKSATRARWSFALSAALLEARRRLWSWSYFKARGSERKKYLELSKRIGINDREYTPTTPLSDDEWSVINQLRQDLRPSDGRFYESLMEYELDRIPRHL